MGKQRSVYFDEDVYDLVSTLKTLHRNTSLNKVVNELCRLGFREYDKFVTTSVEALIEDINRQIKDVKKVIRGLNQVKDAILMCGAYSGLYEEALFKGTDPTTFIDTMGRLKRRRIGLDELKELGHLSEEEEEAIKYILELRKELAQHLVWLVLQHKKLNVKKKGELVQTTMNVVK